MGKSILVLAPTEREYRHMLATIAAKSNLKNSYTVITSRIGKALSAATVSKVLAEGDGKYEGVAIIGFAAGSACYKQADIVAPRVALNHDCRVPDGFIPELTDPFELLGDDDATVFTGDSFVDAPMIREIMERFKCEKAIFDMEIAAVAAAVKQCYDLPVLAVKMVSDCPEHGDTEFSYDIFADSHSDFSPILERIEQIF